MPFLRYFYVLDSVIFLRKRLATLLKKREDDNDTLFWCNVDASWQRRPHGMPLLKTNTTEQISLSYTAKYCQGANIIVIQRQILSRCKYHYHTPPNIVKGQISNTAKHQRRNQIFVINRPSVQHHPPHPLLRSDIEHRVFSTHALSNRHIECQFEDMNKFIKL